MRQDGRRAEELRPVKITRNYIKYAEGSVLIEMGDTHVICTATIEEKVPPFLKGSGTGWVTAEYAMLPRSSQARITRDSAKGKISGRSHEIQRLIGRSLRSVIDMTGLGERSIIIDCDVIQADGGTRTAAITGSAVALADAIYYLLNQKLVFRWLLKELVAAVSVGIVGGEPLLDLAYLEDSTAQVDMNIILTQSGRIVEVQATAEGEPFSRECMDRMMEIGGEGIQQLIKIQQAALDSILPKVSR